VGGAELVEARREAERLRGELDATRETEAAKLALEREARLSLTALVGQQAQDLERLRAGAAALKAEKELLEEGSELAALEERAKEAEDRERLAWAEAQGERERATAKQEAAAGLQRRLDKLVDASNAQTAEIRGLTAQAEAAGREKGRAIEELGHAQEELATVLCSLSGARAAATAAEARAEGLDEAGKLLEERVAQAEQALVEASEGRAGEVAEANALREGRDLAREQARKLQGEASRLEARARDAEEELRETRERAEHMKRSMRAASGIQTETQKGLESELQRKSGELASAEEEVERLAEKCREAERGMKAAEARATDAAREIVSLEDERDRLGADIRERDECLLRKAGELRSAEERCKSLADALKEGAEAHEASLQASRADSCQKEGALQSELESARGKTVKADRARKAAEELSARLETENGVLKAELARTRLAATESIDRIQALQRDLDEAEEAKIQARRNSARVGELETEGARARQELQSCTEALHASRTRAAEELAALREASGRDAARAEEALEAARREAADLRVEIEQRAASGEDLLREFDRQGEELVSLKAQCRALQEQGSAGAAAQQALRAALDANHVEVEGLQGKLQRSERLAKDLAEAQRRIESLSQDLRARGADATRTADTEDALRTSLAEARASCEKATRELTAEFQRSSRLEREAGALRQQFEAVAAEAAELDTLQRERASLQCELEALGRSAVEKDAEVLELRERVRSYKVAGAEKENCAGGSAEEAGAVGVPKGSAGAVGVPPPATNLREADFNRPKAAGVGKTRVWSAEERERMLVRLRRINKRHGLRLAVPLREETGASPSACQAHLVKLMAGVLGALEQGGAPTPAAPERAAPAPRPASGKARGIASLDRPTALRRAGPPPPPQPPAPRGGGRRASEGRQRVLMLH